MKYYVIKSSWSDEFRKAAQYVIEKDNLKGFEVVDLEGYKEKVSLNPLVSIFNKNQKYFLIAQIPPRKLSGQVFQSLEKIEIIEKYLLDNL